MLLLYKIEGFYFYCSKFSKSSEDFYVSGCFI